VDDSTAASFVRFRMTMRPQPPDDPDSGPVERKPHPPRQSLPRAMRARGEVGSLLSRATGVPSADSLREDKEIAAPGAPGVDVPLRTRGVKAPDDEGTAVASDASEASGGPRVPVVEQAEAWEGSRRRRVRASWSRGTRPGRLARP